MNKKIANIICAFIWDKRKRDCLRNKLINPHIQKIANRYKKHIKKLRNIDRKVRICFYVTENQKWKSQALFDELKKNDLFDVFAVFAPRSNSLSLNKEIINTNFDFFHKRLHPLYLGYDSEKNEYKNLQDYEPDIVFYSQPWDIPQVNNIANVSRYALTCYIPYAVAEAVTPMLHNVYSFHFLLWRHYTVHELINDEYSKTIPYVADNLKAVGYQILDDIINNTPSSKSLFCDNCIIYAPHCSLASHPWLRYGTFDWNGKFILEYAKHHPEFNWVFKPHPDFRWAVISSNIMTESEIDNYYYQWEKIGMVYNKGDYVDLFKKSRCMITDCGSFLTEYFVTGKPLIHLKSEYKTDYNELNKIIKESYYKARNLPELQHYLKIILEQKEDPEFSKRENLFNELKFNQTNSVLNIIKDIEMTIKSECFCKK
ncbi:MAG: hypothetical protein E7020_06990 [Alphaproteobacteria bacterium]|nr:hypothetical protein [Alphaproteobacteria bacterium]